MVAKTDRRSRATLSVFDHNVPLIVADEPALDSFDERFRGTSMMRRLLFEELLESLQIVAIDIGNSPVVEVGVNPMQKLIALARHRLHGSVGSCPGRPNKQVNKMFAPLVNQHRRRP